MRKCDVVLTVIVCVVLMTCGKLVGAQTRSRNLLLPLRKSQRLAAIQRPSELRAALARIDRRLIKSLERGTIAKLNLNLFPDANFVARVESMEKPFHDSQAWSGTLEGGFGTFTLVMHKNQLLLNIRLSDGGSYRVRPAGPSAYSVAQINQGSIKECGVGKNDDRGQRTTVSGRATTVRTTQVLRDNGSEIKVLVVYTPAARDLAASQAGHPAGSTAEIESLIDLSMAETNEAYRLSGINPRLRLVYRALQLYNGDGGGGASVYRVLPSFRGRNDGVMDDVHGIRDRANINADICVLLFVSSDAGGLASMMNQYTFSTGFESQAFAVVDMESASGNYAFGHEIGHVQGNCHNRADCTDDQNRLDQGVFPYSYGYRYTTSGTFYHTIMAYRPGALTLHFSNPQVMHNGVPTGVPEGQPQPCDEAKTINNTALVVANFRNNGH